MSEFLLKSARHLAAEAFEKLIRPGDSVVDATMGNGHDTELLARLVGESGHVYAFDIQPQALQNTKERLQSAGLLERATLILESHAKMGEYVPCAVRAVIFNLGWLPGGDKAVTTQLNSTMAAIKTALSLLQPLGMMILCVYPGHPEGAREREEILQYLSALPPQEFNCLCQRFMNAGAGAPLCILAQKQQINTAE